MKPEHPNPTETERLADFLTVLAMQTTGKYPMPIVEAIATRNTDHNREAR